MLQLFKLIYQVLRGHQMTEDQTNFVNAFCPVMNELVTNKVIDLEKQVLQFLNVSL